MTEFVAYLAGGGALVLFFGVVAIVVKGRVWTIVDGFDGARSTSKFQWFAWTATVIFAYVAVYTARAMQGHPEAVSEIPPNVLLAMGFSAATATVAKGITSAYTDNGRIVGKPKQTRAAKKAAAAKAKAKTPPAASPSIGGLLVDDDGTPDLSKIQLMSWTAIAIGIYIYTVVTTVHGIATLTKGAVAPGLPDIDGSLMVLMGLSQGGYLGKKLVSKNSPQMTSLAPPKGIAGQTIITITGAGFGDAMPSSMVCLDGWNIESATWSDSQITFQLPAASSDGPFDVGQGVQVSVYVDGQPAVSAVPLPLTVSPPKQQ
jgi:IPT/TIG domain-containing protein